MVTLKHYGRINKGKKVYHNPKLHQETVDLLEGCEFEETIKERHKKVSEDAFGYYYGGVIGEALKYEIFSGWSKDDIDDFFSGMFLTYTKTLCLKHDDGSESFTTIKKVESKASGFSSKKMKAFTERVIQWLAENGIIVRSSEDYILNKYKTEVKHIK